MKMLQSLALAALLAPLSVAAQAPQQWLEGVHYDLVDVQYDAPEDGSIEVVELFWYGCGSCFQFEPHVQRWLQSKPDDVRFVRVAATMSPAWRTHARAFYTAEQLDVVERVHAEIFRALHVERQSLNDVDAFAAFFDEHADVDPAEFRRAWDSFGVETRVRRGDQFARRYQLTGVPAVIVAGKYRTNPGRAQGYAQLIELIDHLVELERGGPAAAGEDPPPATATEAEAETDAAPLADPEEVPEPGKPGMMLWWLLAAALLVVIVVAVVAMSSRKRSE